MVRLRYLVPACAALLWTATAFGQAMDPREVQARKDCLSGRVEAGTALLVELFAETANPNFVYNQARCFEQNAQPDLAIQRFREFLRIARDLSADEKADTERHIAECRAMKAEHEQSRGIQVAVPPAAAPVPTVVAPRAIPAPEAFAVTSVAETQAAPSSSAGSGLRKGGVAIGALGVVAAGAGVAFSLLARGTQSSVEADGRKGFYDPNKDARGRTYATLQWVGYGVGAAATVTGVTLYYLGHRSRKDESAKSVALLPVVGPGRGGLVLQGGF